MKGFGNPTEDQYAGRVPNSLSFECTGWRAEGSHVLELKLTKGSIVVVRVSIGEGESNVLLVTGLVDTLGIYGGIIRMFRVREPRACVVNVRDSLFTSLLRVVADKECEMPIEVPKNVVIQG